jgi:hypothetical protein
MRIFRAFLFSGCSALIAGCSGAPFTAPVNTTSVQGAAIQGRVHGGQTVISGARLYLYAANNTGYGNASISLLNSSGSNTQKDSNGNYYVTTGADGSFGITGDYTCPSTESQVYLYAVGGNPGLPAGSNNPSIGLLLALGNCPANGTLSPTLYVVINEVTTIAAAYSLAGFATDATHVSSSGTPLAVTGITNAFENSLNLASFSTGNALTTTPAGNGTVPQALINTLADLLAACVNSNGAVSGPTNPTVCYTLFNDTLSGGTTGSVPTDTATAAIYLAHNPGANLNALGSLFEMLTGQPPFQPTVTSNSNTNDLTVSIAFTGGGLNKPYSIAVDANGNVWLGNSGGNSVTKFSHMGDPFTDANGYTGGGISDPYGVAIDAQNNVWVENFLVNTVTELSNFGAVLSPGTGYTGGYFSLGGVGVSIAIDGSGNVWIPNGNTGVTKLSSGGAVVGSYTGSGLDQPNGIAVDGSGNAWFSNISDKVSEFSSSGSVLSGTNGYSVSSVPLGLAIDGSGNAWVGTESGGVAEELSNSGAVLYAPTGSQNATVFGIDGAGSAWTLGGGEIIGISSSGSILSGPYGYEPSSLDGAQAAAIDGSGDIWVANGGNNTVTEIIGAAVPVITPICAGLPATPTSNGTSNLGSRP